MLLFASKSKLKPLITEPDTFVTVIVLPPYVNTVPSLSTLGAIGVNALE